MTGEAQPHLPPLTARPLNRHILIKYNVSEDHVGDKGEKQQKQLLTRKALRKIYPEETKLLSRPSNGLGSFNMYLRTSVTPSRVHIRIQVWEVSNRPGGWRDVLHTAGSLAKTTPTDLNLSKTSGGPLLCEAGSEALRREHHQNEKKRKHSERLWEEKMNRGNYNTMNGRKKNIKILREGSLCWSKREITVVHGWTCSL